MLQGKQTDRLTAKIMRLGEVYGRYLIESEINFDVYITENSATRPVKTGDSWGGEFCCADFSFTVPKLEHGKRYRLVAETGAVEHLVSVNGKKIGLIDYVENAFEPMFREHRYLLLDGLNEGDKVNVQGYYSHTIPGTMPYDTAKTFALDGHYPDRRFKKITLVTFYEKLYDFLLCLKFLGSCYRTGGEWERARIDKVCEKLFCVLPIMDKRPSESELGEAIKLIGEYGENLKNDIPYVGLIGHSHLDTAWLWTLEETRRKLLRTVSNAVTLLKRYDDYRFFLSTVLYLKWLEEDDKELFAEVKKLIAEGRIEVNGGAWVECDCNLIGAEALCRQFLRGIRYTREKFGYSADVFWLPDTFGYSAALPQILNLAGIKSFLTTKLSWNDTNVFPYESFRWKGMDGSEVTVHFNSTHTSADTESVAARLKNVKDKHIGGCVLMAYGYGDGGGGPSDEMVQGALNTIKTCSFAKVEHTTVSDFMQRLSREELPLYYGELYLELHRGTFTSVHDLKLLNRRLGEALHDLELISVFEDNRGNKEISDKLYDIYLLNSFHDILPGTCIEQATDEALTLQRNALEEAENTMCKGDSGVYFNTLAFGRTELLPCTDGQKYVDLNGDEVCLAPFDFQAFGYAQRSGKKYKITAGQNTVRTEDLCVTFGGGKIVSLVFRGREYCAGGFNIITYAENAPLIYDNWDIDADYVLKKKEAVCTECKIVSQGKYFAVLRVKYRITDNSSLITDITVRADSPQIEFDNVLTAGDDHIIIKAEFDTSLFSPHYSCETQFGHIERNAYPSAVSDNAKFEVCSHKWTDISENGCGLSLLSDVKYGVSCNGGRLGLTLHKGGTHPDSRADKGVHRFRYALYPHEGPLGADTVRRGYSFNYRPRLTDNPGLKPPFEFDGGNSVMLETVKFGEDGGTVLRLYECLGATSRAALKARGKEIYVCNLLEDVQSKAGEVLEFSPFEIKTVLLK